MNALSSWSGPILSLLRIMSALLFMQHGTQKLLQFPLEAGDTRAYPALFSMIWFAGIIEFVGGILLTLGFFTRITAFICSGMAAVAYFMVHAPRDFYPVLNGGELAALYCFVFLYLAAAGGGPWSLDAMRNKK